MFKAIKKTIIIWLYLLIVTSAVHAAQYSIFTGNDYPEAAESLITEKPGIFKAASKMRRVDLPPVFGRPGGIARGDQLVMNLFGTYSFIATVDRVNRDVLGTITVRGRLDDFPMGYILISTNENQSLISIRVPERKLEFAVVYDPLMRAHYLLDIDPAKIDRMEDSPVLIPPPASILDQKEKRISRNAVIQNLGVDDPASIGVMIVYTSAARLWAETNGGGIFLVIAQAMESAQLVQDNSNTGVTMQLVHSEEVDYVESGVSGKDLERLTYTSDGYMDEVHALRDFNGADIVAMFTKIDDTGGVGWVLNSTSGSPGYAFSISRVQQVGWTYTLIHEMGHNMGLGHHKEQTVQPGPGLFSYSAGWRWTGTDSNGYCSVMTYGSATYDNVPYFSNPNISYQGVPTGDAIDGDNARNVREIKHVVAGYRASIRPVNDDFSNATVVAGFRGRIIASNVSATKESGEPDHAGNAGGASIWWRWTAPKDDEITVDTYGSEVNTLLAVYTGGSVDALSMVASNDNDGGGVQSRVVFTAAKGVTYLIAVDGSDNESGNINLNWVSANPGNSIPQGMLHLLLGE